MPSLPFLSSAWLLGFHLLCAGSAGAADSKPADRPNILFFLVDDMGVTDTSLRFLQDATGKPITAPLNERYRTPNMERLAAQGRTFTNARAYSVCTPTRVSLMTGQEAPRLHITTWTHPQHVIDTGKLDKNGLTGPKWRMEGLDLSLPTLPRLLAKSGYATIHCGKAHFGPTDTPAGDPKNLGFEVNIAGCGIGGPGSYWGAKNFSAAWRGGGHDWDIPGLEKYHGKDVFLTEALTRELSSTLEATVREKKPFFAYMAHYAVHGPFEADARFTAHYPELKGKDLAFATLVEGMDKSLGDLLETLDQLGVAENTLVIFYSDNGSDGPLNLPLLGKKGTRFDGGSRVPMIAAWAKSNPAHPLQQALPIIPGSRADNLVTPADFLPTLAAITRTPLPDHPTIDGRDLSPALRGNPDTEPSKGFLVHFPHGRHNDELFSTWIEGNHKLIYQYESRDWQLFDIRKDISEQHDLKNNDPKLALDLARHMLAHMRKVDAQFPIDRKSGSPVTPDLGTLPKTDSSPMDVTSP